MPDSPSPSRRDVLLGALLMTTAMLCFVLLDSTIKALVQRHDALVLTFFRNLAQVLVLVALMPALGVVPMLRATRPRLLAWRGLLLAASTVLMALGLRYLPLVQMYAITFLAPLLAVLVARLALGEAVSPRQWACILAGFGGVLVIVQPDASAGLGWVLLLPIGMAAINGVFHVVTRYAGRSEHPLAILFHTSAWALVLSALPLPLVWEPMPAADLALVAVGGTFGTVAHLCLIQAFRRAPTAVISPMLYTQVLWASLVGWILFGEVPAATTVAGFVIVAVAGIVLVRLGTRRAP